MIKQIKINRDFTKFLKTLEPNCITSGDPHNYKHIYYNLSNRTIFEYSESRNMVYIRQNEMKFAFSNFDHSLMSIIMNFIGKKYINITVL